MEVLKILTTVFDSIFICLIIWVGATANERKQLGVCVWLLIMTILNLYCMWG